MSSYHRPVDTVCVTGASGYVATELVKELLEDGYSVHGTVRDLTKTDVIGHLTKFQESMPGSSLKLFELDLTNLPTDTCEAMKGCKTLFHTAAPFTFGAKDMKEEIMKPTVDSIHKLFEAASKAGIERVVLTSSVAAVTSFLPEDKPGKILTEEDWNTDTDESIWLENPVQAYMASKSLQEQAAMEASKKFGIKLSCINPSLVCGPVYYGRQPTSIANMKTALEGGAHPFTFPWIDIRDVAKAHIECMRQGADGRFICASTKMYTPSYVAKVLSEAFPYVEFPTDLEEQEPFERFDNSKVEKLLGRPLRSPEETMVTMARTMYAGGFATPKLKKYGE